MLAAVIVSRVSAAARAVPRLIAERSRLVSAMPAWDGVREHVFDGQPLLKLLDLLR